MTQGPPPNMPQYQGPQRRHPGHPQQPPRQDDAVATLIPYRNSPALISYYLGVFSLIPCLGGLLGVAAVVLGIIGLKRAAANPEARGKVHAIVGIILGGLFGLIWLISTIVFVIALISHS